MASSSLTAPPMSMKSNPKKNKTKIIFFGTHKFAATILEALCKEPTIEVALVVTQPDKPSGRKQEIQPGPMKQLAREYKIPIEQPTTLKSFQFPVYCLRRQANFQLGITAQYGG